MKKQLLAIAVLGALAAPAFADNNVTLYGRIDMGLERSDDGTTSRFVEQNFASRIGFKGEEDLGGGLKALFQIETGVSPDDSANSAAWASRNSFVGLKGDFGTVLMGNHDMPFKSLDRNVGTMWNQTDPIEQVVNGKASAGAIGANFHTRQKNVVQYHSPVWSGFQLKAAFSPDEAKVDGGTNKQVYGLSAEYNAGPWNIGAGYENKQDAATKGKDLSAVKLIGGLKIDAFTLGAAYAKLDNDNGSKVDTWALVGNYTIGATTLKAAYGTADESKGNAQDGTALWSFEVDYSLSKRTTVYGYYAAYKNDGKSKAKFETGDNKYAPVAGEDPSVFGVAVRHNF
ncbi:porin [Chitinimonas koreensis]|uniref:porin n=1 Tax=Chitinimonas koreensis TaxID=356302 RepID=UPI000421BD48|nr:porin [Chitinimonas koreensis]QNM95248.1 porin [Chitinimonas koreensis]